MSKGGGPALQMIVQRGHLVPAGIYEAEVIDGYSQGAVLTVEMRQKRSLPLLKKYWAVLGDLIENAKTPWETREEASDALKLALGITDVGKTVRGQWFIRPGSVSFNSMDEAAFRSFFEHAMALLAQVTGIDPESLADQYRHIPESNSAAPQAAPQTRDDGEGSDVPPEASTKAQPETAAGEAATDQQTAAAVIPCAQAAAGGGPASPCGAPADPSTLKGQLVGSLRLECVHKLLQLASDNALTPEQRSENLDLAVAWWRDALPDDHDFVKTVFDQALDVSAGKTPTPQALRYLKGLAAGK